MKLNKQERELLDTALGQWAEEYATTEQHPLAHELRARIQAEADEEEQ